jgi:hypothetical protein
MKSLKKLILKLLLIPILITALEWSSYSQEKIFPKIDKIYLTSCVNNQTCSTDSKDVTLEDKVNLNMVAEFQKNGQMFYLSKSKNICLNGKKIDSTRIYSWEPNDISIKWFKIEPKESSYNNGRGNSFRWDKINYKETLIDSNKWVIEPDAHPTDKFKDINDGLGTMRYKVKIFNNGRELFTPGKESTDIQGIKKDVHRISFRKDNSFVGWLSSFFNLPYIYGSSGIDSETHQSENYVGADCADLLVAAYRKSGKKIPYTYAAGLSNFANIVVKQSNLRTDGENYYNQNKLLEFGKDVKEGDLILFGTSHVGAIIEDKSNPDSKYAGRPDGIFNIYDLMIHTLFDNPTKENVGGRGMFSILRWKN